MALVLSTASLVFSLCVALLPFSLCQKMNTEFSCYDTVTDEDWEKITNAEFLTAYAIGPHKNTISCTHDVVRGIDGRLEVTAEYYIGTKRFNYDKTLIRGENGKVQQLLDGQYTPFYVMIFPNGMITSVHCSLNAQSIYISYPIDRPELLEESKKLAHYYVKNPADYEVAQVNCKRQDLYAYIAEQEKAAKSEL